MLDDQPETERLWATYAYRAFISYSHVDKAIGARLHRRLEAYRVPAKLVGKATPVGPAPVRLAPIFRDFDELPASADLGAELRAAISNSMFLVVICSPSAAASRWVEQEIIQFKQTHGPGRVLALIVAGTPNASDMPGREAEECFPRALRFQLGADGQVSDTLAEPIAADVRPGSDGRRRAHLRLIAGLTGLKLDELVRREQRRTRQRIALYGAGALSIVAALGGMAGYANLQRIEAETARAVTLSTRGMFRSDRGDFAKAETELTQSLAMLRRVRGERHVSTARGWYLLAMNAFTSGRLPLAEVRIAEALKVEDPQRNAAFVGDALEMQGQILQGAGRSQEAERSLQRAVATYRSIPGGSRESSAIAEVHLGMAQSDQGRHADALNSLDAAKRDYDAAYGKLHPNHGDLLVTRAKVLARAGRMEEAHTNCAAGTGILAETLGQEATFTRLQITFCDALGRPNPKPVPPA